MPHPGMKVKASNIPVSVLHPALPSVEVLAVAPNISDSTKAVMILAPIRKTAIGINMKRAKIATALLLGTIQSLDFDFENYIMQTTIASSKREREFG